MTNAVTDSAATVSTVSESAIRVKVDSMLQASSQAINTSWGEGAFEQSLHIVLYDTEKADTNGVSPVKAVIDRETKATRRDSTRSESNGSMERESTTLMNDSLGVRTLGEVTVTAEQNQEYDIMEYYWEKVKKVNRADLYVALSLVALLIAIIVWIRIKRIL